MRIEAICLRVEFKDKERFYLVRFGERGEVDEYGIRDATSGYFWKMENDIGMTLNKDGVWEEALFPFNSTDEYLANNRHTYTEAIELLIKWKGTNQ